MQIQVTKLTGLDLLRKCASFTTGRDCKMSLRQAYKLGHSLTRTQLFLIEMRDIPLFCASQLVRSHVGLQWFQRSKRTDRGGADFRETCRCMADDLRSYNDTPDLIHTADSVAKEIDDLPLFYDRYAPTDLCGILNAEAIINISYKRLCSMASKETRELWQEVLHKLREVDSELVKLCVQPCVHTGFCRETKTCGFFNSRLFLKLRHEYLTNFV